MKTDEEKLMKIEDICVDATNPVDALAEILEIVRAEDSTTTLP